MISIVYCTRESKPEHEKHLIKTSGLHNKVEVIEIINNGESLTKSYNRGLKEAKYDKVVFCHDDILVETKQWGKKLLKHFDNNEHGIIGVAGTKFLHENGKWWTDRKAMYGKVKHTHKGKSWLSEYSPSLENNVEDVVLVDGLFFAVDKNRLKLDFDETVEGFHFYDVDFCFRNLLEGVKVGVITNIRINHMSIGETNNEWEDNRILFSEKYKENLPYKIDETFKNRKMKVLLTCLSFSKLTGSEISTFELAKELKKNGCEVSICSNLGQPLMGMAKKEGIKLYSLSEPPGYKLGDGKWGFNSPNGYVLSKVNMLYKVKDIDFDIIQLNHKPISKRIIKLYPNEKFVNIVRSVRLDLEDPIIDKRIGGYIAISDIVKDSMIKRFNIDEKDISTIHNIVNVKSISNKNPNIDKTIYCFPGTMNYLRKGCILNAIDYTKDKGELWLVGDDSDFGYAEEYAKKYEHVKYLGIEKNMSKIYNDVDVVMGLYLGRTLLEGIKLDKKCIAYTNGDNGEFLNKFEINNNDYIDKLNNNNIVNEYIYLYKEIINKF